MGLNLVDNLFAKYCLNSILNNKFDINVTGTAEQIKAICEVITATRNFHNELKNENSSIETILALLNAKNKAASNYEKTLNIKWLL